MRRAAQWRVRCPVWQRVLVLPKQFGFERAKRVRTGPASRGCHQPGQGVARLSEAESIGRSASRGKKLMVMVMMMMSSVGPWVVDARCQRVEKEKRRPPEKDEVDVDCCSYRDTRLGRMKDVVKSPARWDEQKLGPVACRT